MPNSLNARIKVIAAMQVATAALEALRQAMDELDQIDLAEGGVLSDQAEDKPFANFKLHMTPKGEH